MAPTLERGVTLEDQGQYATARDLYVASMPQHQQSFALLAFRAGRCEEALGNFDTAGSTIGRPWITSRAGHSAAPPARQNAVVRTLSRQYDVPLVDAVEHLRRMIPAPDHAATS